MSDIISHIVTQVVYMGGVINQVWRADSTTITADSTIVTADGFQ